MIFHIFILNFILFLLGFIGIIVNRQSLILILISIELILLSINLNFLFFSYYIDDLIGEIFALIVLTVAASEAAIGLAILIILFRLKGSININNLNLLAI